MKRKRNTLVTSIGKGLRSVFNKIPFFDPLEKKFVEKGNENLLPPLFIVGTPRSGSTLLYNILTRNYRFAYITNIGSVFPRFPVLFYWMINGFLFQRKSKSIDSHYGLVNGFSSPSEAGAINERWFSNQKLDKRFIRHSVARLSVMMQGPFISKNLYNSLRLKRIFEVFPKAIFIFIKRTAKYNAQSIYYAQVVDRITISDNYLSRLNIHPGNDALENALLTVVEMERHIENFFHQNNCTVIEINYEDLCRDYQSEIKKIHAAYEKIGYTLNKIISEQIKLEISERKSLNDADWKRLETLYASYS